MRIWNFLIIYSCWSDGGLIEENDTAVDENLGEKKTVFLKDVLPKDEYKVRDPRTKAGRPHRAASTKSKIQGSHRTRTKETPKISNQLAPRGPRTRRCVDSCIKWLKKKRKKRK